MKIIWASDIHINFISLEARKAFYTTLNEAEGDIVLFTGDIAEGDKLESYLKEFDEYIKKPVYFVLGNHDFYGSSQNEVHQIAVKYNWLGIHSYIDGDTALIGVDGWADGRNGDFYGSHLIMNDWFYIEDLHHGNRQKLLEKMQKLADTDAAVLKSILHVALQRGAKKIVIASHVPPFEEVCLHTGRKSDPSGLPFFSSKILGDTVLPIVEANPKVEFLWLCGHTHSGVTAHIKKNLTVKVAEVQYGFPSIAEVIDV